MRGAVVLVLSVSVFLVTLLVSSDSLSQEKKKAKGRLEIHVADDFEKGRANSRYFLKDQTGKKTEIHFNKGKAPSWLAPEQELEISGTQYNSGISADSTEVSLITEAPLITATQLSTLVIIVDIDGGTNSMTAREAESAMFGSSNSVRDLFLKNSFGKLDFVPDGNGDGKIDVYGPVRITQQIGTSCSYGNWGIEALSLIKSQTGIDPDVFRYKMFILPSNVPCSWSGLAAGASTYIKGGGVNAPFIMAHELGHAIGLGHASLDRDNNGTNESEYGDISCNMGNDAPELRYFNAPHAYKKGFYADQPGSVVTLTESQTVEIFPLELDPATTSGARIVRVPRLGTRDYFYLSLRSSVSYDKSMPAYLSDAISIHRSGDQPYASSFITSVSEGQEWEDLASGIKISAVKRNTRSILVSVTVEALSCTARPPTIGLSNSYSVSNTSEGNVRVGMAIVNNDSLGCGATSFKLLPELPAGVVSSLPEWSVYLGGGGKSSVYFDMSYKDLQTGLHSLQFRVVDSDSNEPFHADSLAVASLLVDLVAPTAPSNITFRERRGIVTLGWTESQDLESGVAHYLVYRDTGSGFQLVANSGNPSFADSNGGGATYKIQAVDRAGNISEFSTEITVQVSKRKGRR